MSSQSLVSRISVAAMFAVSCGPPGPETAMESGMLPSVTRQVIGPEGGTLDWHGQHPDFPQAMLSGRLLIPPGALVSPIEVVVNYRTSLAHEDERVAGPAIRVTPSNLMLREPAELWLPHDEALVTVKDALRIGHGEERVSAENVLRHFAVRARPQLFKTPIGALGDYQALVKKPDFPAGGIMMNEKFQYLDFLFVVDNSWSMTTKQLTLIEQFPKLFDKIKQCKDVNVNIGFVTTDVGTVPAGKGTWANSMAPSCNSENGDAGRLQGAPCDMRLKGADAKCTTACPKSIGPVGQPYIHYEADAAGTIKTSNVSGNKITEAFRCLAYQGDQGCGIESPFEAIERALTNPANKGFFRSLDPALAAYSVLVVVVLTDEDDCSVAQRDWSNPDPKQMTNDPTSPRWQRFDLNTRCLGLSTRCKANDNLLFTSGTKEDGTGSGKCEPYDYGYLTKVADAVSKLTDKGNRTVLFGGIWPLNPVDIWNRKDPAMRKRYDAAGNPAPSLFSMSYRPGSPTTESPDLQVDIQPCPAPPKGIRDAGVQPQHRLSSFAESDELTAGYQGDICQPAEYVGVLEVIGDALTKKCR